MPSRISRQPADREEEAMNHGADHCPCLSLPSSPFHLLAVVLSLTVLTFVRSFVSASLLLVVHCIHRFPVSFIYPTLLARNHCHPFHRHSLGLHPLDITRAFFITAIPALTMPRTPSRRLARSSSDQVLVSSSPSTLHADPLPLCFGRKRSRNDVDLDTESLPASPLSRLRLEMPSLDDAHHSISHPKFVSLHSTFIPDEDSGSYFALSSQESTQAPSSTHAASRKLLGSHIILLSLDRDSHPPSNLPSSTRPARKNTRASTPTPEPCFATPRRRPGRDRGRPHHHQRCRHQARRAPRKSGSDANPNVLPSSFPPADVRSLPGRAAASAIAQR